MTATDLDPAAMPLGNAILAAVIAEPGADLHRLAYADLCEESGDDARAEFVRVQCELARDFAGVNDAGVKDGLTDAGKRRHPRFAALARRERELLHDPVHWWAWLADLYAITGRSAIGDLGHCSDDQDAFAVRFRRGFVAEMRLTCDAWAAHGPALVRAVPLERVTLSGKVSFMGRWLRHSGGLELSYKIPPPLYRLLRGGQSGRTKKYRDDAAALAALSDACLAWARAAPVAPAPPAG